MGGQRGGTPRGGWGTEPAGSAQHHGQRQEQTWGAKPSLRVGVRAETPDFCLAKGSGEKHLNLEIQPGWAITLPSSSTVSSGTLKE